MAPCVCGNAWLILYKHTFGDVELSYKSGGHRSRVRLALNKINSRSVVVYRESCWKLEVV